MKQNQPSWRSSDETPKCQPKQFTDEEISTRYFSNGYRLLCGERRVTLEPLVIIDQLGDYCRCRQIIGSVIDPKGISAETEIRFSGLLSPEAPLPESIATLAEQLRKADV